VGKEKKEESERERRKETKERVPIGFCIWTRKRQITFFKELYLPSLLGFLGSEETVSTKILSSMNRS
jgi:hypothetical protein